MPYCRNLFSNDFDQSRADSFVLKITDNSLRLFGFMRLFLAGLLFVPSLGAANELSPVEQLGKQLFFDTNLSTPAGQSCASCHAPEAGFSGPDSQVNLRTGVYPGAAPGRFGTENHLRLPMRRSVPNEPLKTIMRLGSEDSSGTVERII